MNPRLYLFCGGEVGTFQVTAQRTVCGDPLPAVARLLVTQSSPEATGCHSSWTLRGVVSNERYVTGVEKQALVGSQAPLGRAEARSGALIPIRKTAEWWALPQDERRAIMEERSRHIAIGMRYLPAVARRLHHCRDLDSAEPFDFLTWFDYQASDAARFDDLLGELRSTPEWQFVDREVEIRVAR